MRKFLFVLLLLAAASSLLSAQNNRGFGMHSEVGAGINLTGADNSTLHLYLSPGYRLNNLFFVGVGAGVSYHYTNRIPGDNFIAAPIYAHGMVTIPTRGNWKPFVNLKIGYGIVSFTGESFVGGPHSTKYDVTGGFYINPAIGVKYQLNAKHALSLSAGYDALTYATTGSTYKATFNNESISIRLGWEF